VERNDTSRTSDEPPRASDEARLIVLDAIVKALDRRVEVLDLVVASENADTARRKLIRLLDTTDSGANAILELSVRRYTQGEVQRIRAERDAARARLGHP